MKMDAAQKLRDEWGDKICDHPRYDAEYSDTGMSNGDYICVACGRVLNDQQMKQIDSRRQGTSK